MIGVTGNMFSTVSNYELCSNPIDVMLIIGQMLSIAVAIQLADNYWFQMVGLHLS